MLSASRMEGHDSVQEEAAHRARQRRKTPTHTCHHCDRMFKRSEHLRRHVRTHTKEKPFICHCGAAFARRDLLTRHQRLTIHAGFDTVAPESEAASTPYGTAPDLEAAAATAAAESLSSLSMLNAAPLWDQQPGARTAQAFVDANVTQRTLAPTTNGGAQQYDQSLMAPQMFDQGDDMHDFDTHFREFADFLDGVGLPAEWSPYFHVPDRDDDLIDSVLRETEAARQAQANPAPGARMGTPFSSWLPSAPGNHMAGAGYNEIPGGRGEVASPLFKITDEQRARLSQSLDAFCHVVEPGFKLPSRHALTRYVTSYFEGFHTHMVFIHVHTWRVLDNPIELVLSIATIGAQYCFEHRNAERLFHAGRAIVVERLRHESDRFGPKTRSLLNMHQGGQTTTSHTSSRRGSRIRPRNDEDYAGPWEPMDTVRALINLMGYATWEPKEWLVQEAFSLQSLLAHVLRDLGLHEDAEPEPGAIASDLTSLPASWLAWVRQESVRRTKLIAFSFIHIHSVAYNVYPVLRSNELHLRLPCSTKEWKAPTARQWQSARREIGKEQLHFQEALSLLLKNEDSSVPLDPIPTPLGNYLLLHGLLQRIYIVRDLSLPIMDHSASLPAEEVDKLDRGLRSWTTGWQQAPESSLDPNNENGPIPFTSSSLLGLAYVRLHLNLGPYRQLETRDPGRIAAALFRCPGVRRSDGVVSALLYAAHALSVPVRLGVDRVARSQAFFWSVRHSLSGFECAVLLSKWLAALPGGDTGGLTGSEERILHWVRCIVEEAFDVVDFEQEDERGEVDMGEELSLDPGGLSLAVLKIWAHFFKSNTQWPFINIIGASLQKYREMLVSRGGGGGRPAVT